MCKEFKGCANEAEPALSKAGKSRDEGSLL